MKNLLFILISSISFAKQSGVPPIEINTCYIKWDSLSQQHQVEKDREMYRSDSTTIAKYKLNNDQIKIVSQTDKDTYQAIIGTSKSGQDYISKKRKEGETKFSFAANALTSIKTKDLKDILTGFETVSCEEPFISPRN